MHQAVVHLKRALERFALLLGRERIGRRKAISNHSSLNLPAGIFFDLLGQQRDEIEGRVNPGEFLQNLHHAPVIFQGVQPGPRQHVLSRRGVAVLRLVHVPEDYEVDSAHRLPAFLLARNPASHGEPSASCRQRKMLAEVLSARAKMSLALLCAFSIDT